MKRGMQLLPALGLVLALSACRPGSSVSVDLSASSVQVLRGSTASVEVLVGGSGSEPAALSIGGLPAGLAADFEPDTVADGAASAALTLDAARGAAEQTATLTVTATRGGSAATAELRVTVASLSISGRVMGPRREGLDGLTVAVEAESATTTTGADGSFTLDGLSVPYDLVVLDAGTGAYGHVLKGMSATELEIMTPAGLPGVVPPQVSAQVNGQLPAMVPVDAEARVCVEGISAPAFGCATVEAGNQTYGLEVTWVGNADVDVRVRAVLTQYDGTGSVTAFPGYGTSADVTLADGENVPLDVASYDGAPSTRTLPGRIEAPTGYPPYALLVFARVSPNLLMPVARIADPTREFDVLVPELGGGGHQLVAGADAPDATSLVAWRTGLDGSGTTLLRMPDPASAVAPPDGATGVTTATTFRVDDPNETVETFLFDSSSPQRRFLVTTTDDEAQLPDLSSFGLPVPGATELTWGVLQSSWAPTLEEAATGWVEPFPQVVNASQLGGPGPSKDGWLLLTGSRAFTTN